MDRQSSTSDNGSYRNCSKIFDPHGDGSSIGPQTNRTLSEMVPWRCLTLALERLLARRPDGILVDPAELIVSPSVRTASRSEVHGAPLADSQGTALLLRHANPRRWAW